MTATAASAEALRARGRSIRRTAALLERIDITVLINRAGGDTWLGPTADQCLDDLACARRLLLHAGNDLRSAAQQLERQADAAAHAAAVANAVLS